MLPMQPRSCPAWVRVTKVARMARSGIVLGTPPPRSWWQLVRAALGLTAGDWIEAILACLWRAATSPLGRTVVASGKPAWVRTKPCRHGRGLQNTRG